MEQETARVFDDRRPGSGRSRPPGEWIGDERAKRLEGNTVPRVRRESQHPCCIHMWFDKIEIVFHKSKVKNLTDLQKDGTSDAWAYAGVFERKNTYQTCQVFK